MKPFIYTGLPSRVVFGVGSVAQLPAEVARLGAKRVLMLSTPGRAAMVRELAKGVSIAGVFDKAVMHTPLELANEARELARRLEADCCVAVGGGSTIGFGMPHAETHSIVLPHAVRYNRDAAPEAMARIAKALGGTDAPTALFELEAKLRIPMKLSQIGMKEADLERAARIAIEAPYPNPRKVEYEPVLALLRDAYEGRRPA